MSLFTDIYSCNLVSWTTLWLKRNETNMSIPFRIVIHLMVSFSFQFFFYHDEFFFFLNVWSIFQNNNLKKCVANYRVSITRCTVLWNARIIEILENCQKGTIKIKRIIVLPVICTMWPNFLLQDFIRGFVGRTYENDK